MFILALPYPVNTQKFFGALFPLITFDLFPADSWIYEPYLGFAEVEPDSVNTQFNELGYENILLLMNMGSMFFMIIFTPIRAIVIKILFAIVPVGKKWWPVPQIEKMHKRLPNDLYEQIDQTYLVVLIMTQINVIYQNYTNFVWTLNTITSLVFYFVWLALPFHLAIIYAIRMHESSCEEESDKLNADFLEAHGTFVKDFRLHRLGKKATIFLVFYRFVYQFVPVIAIFAFLKAPIWSIIILLLNELVSTCVLLHFRPYKSTKEYLKALYEKAVLFVTIYHLFIFTEWTDLAGKSMAGNTIIFFIVGQTAIMVALLIIDNTATTCMGKLKAKRLAQRRRVY